MIADLLLPAAVALGPSPAEVLHAWDDRRAAAWSAGDVAALRDLYAPGSDAGRADAAMLRAWTRRDLRVSGLRMQLLAVVVRDRAPSRLVLDVIDRLAGGAAEPGGLPLPRDRPSRHLVTLREIAGEWRVTAVSTVSAARSG